MKKLCIVIVSLMGICFALNVQAANVTFAPDVVKLKVKPGETGRTALTVHGFSKSTYSLNFLVGSKKQKGNSPLNWLTSAYLWLDSGIDGTSSRPMDFIVTVPPDTKPGTYSGLIVPDDMQCSESISSPGVLVAIEVSDI
jgi:hypothetical protein